MELSNPLGAFVYFAFPGCFQLWLFGAFPVNFLGARFSFSDATGQSFPISNLSLIFLFKIP